MVLRSRQAKLNGSKFLDIDEENDIIDLNTKWDIYQKLSNDDYKSDLVKVYPNGIDFSVEQLENDGFKTPILFEEKTGLNLKLPEKDDFSVDDVAELVGKSRVLDVVDVNTQDAIGMTMKNWCKYYNSTNKSRLLNVISLEFSQTKMDKIIKAPDIVSKIDWLENCWPNKDFHKSEDSKSYLKSMTYPKVRKYCLMSVEGCYTDFHIDLGGTSVWYHIFKGSKIFWMIPPTEDNIAKYEKWCMSPDQSSCFFPDLVDACQQVELKQGTTFMIPSGWIHGVFTPCDSLVFGGNFLHSLSIEMQLRIWMTEQRLRVDIKYRYPFFIEMYWFVLAHIMYGLINRQYLHDYQISNYAVKSYEKEKLSVIIEWLNKVSFKPQHNIPKNIIDPPSLLSDAENIINNLSTSSSCKYVSFFEKFSQFDWTDMSFEQKTSNISPKKIKLSIKTEDSNLNPDIKPCRNLFDSFNLSPSKSPKSSICNFTKLSTNDNISSIKSTKLKTPVKRKPPIKNIKLSAEIPNKMFEQIATQTKSRKIIRPDRFVENQ